MGGFSGWSTLECRLPDSKLHGRRWWELRSLPQWFQADAEATDPACEFAG
jgi:hypothetical protein